MPSPEPDTKESRDRSRSPRRSRSPGPRKPKNYSGLKWKKNEGGGRDEPRSLKDDWGRRAGGRGDRDRRDDRDRGRDRFDDRERRDRDRRDDRERRPRRDDDNRERRDRDSRREPRDSERRRPRDDKDKEKEKSEKKIAPAAPAPAGNGEPMIMVTVNDRLGTKAQIPCMASDPVKVFKHMVAAKIGRPVHEIMLKRQGQRPFHDSLTLADYEVSHGVQIDLELNTGD